jgi:hypothetical protein
VAARQLGLFTTGAPDFGRAFDTVRRLALDHDAWIEHVPAWVSGHDTTRRGDLLVAVMFRPLWQADPPRTLDPPRPPR